MHRRSVKQRQIYNNFFMVNLFFAPSPFIIPLPARPHSGFSAYAAQRLFIHFFFEYKGFFGILSIASGMYVPARRGERDIMRFPVPRCENRAMVQLKIRKLLSLNK